MQLSKLPNIGKALEMRLNQSNINTAEELKNMGSKIAFKRIREVDPTACFNTLYALEGAIQGIRWHHLEKEIKQDLHNFFIDL